MILNMNLCVAVKNPLSYYESCNIDLFKLYKNKFEFSSVDIHLKNKEFKIKAKCPICGNTHLYSYNINDIMNDKFLIGGCYEIGVPIFYVGKISKVENKIKKYNNLYNNIYKSVLQG